MTNSAFVLDWSRPVPLEEFFLPAGAVTIPAYQACTEDKQLSSKRHRIVRQPNATANEQVFSSESLLVDPQPGPSCAPSPASTTPDRLVIAELAAVLACTNQLLSPPLWCALHIMLRAH